MVGVRHVLILIVFSVYTTKCEPEGPELGAGASVARRDDRMKTQHVQEKLTRPWCGVPSARQMVRARTSHVYINPQPRHPAQRGHPQ